MGLFLANGLRPLAKKHPSESLARFFGEPRYSLISQHTDRLFDGGEVDDAALALPQPSFLYGRCEGEVVHQHGIHHTTAATQAVWYYSKDRHVTSVVHQHGMHHTTDVS